MIKVKMKDLPSELEPIVDEVDLAFFRHPRGSYTNPDLMIRMYVCHSIDLHCDEEYRKGVSGGSWHEGPHADDADNTLPDPMASDSVY